MDLHKASSMKAPFILPCTNGDFQDCNTPQVLCSTEISGDIPNIQNKCSEQSNLLSNATTSDSYSPKKISNSENPVNELDDLERIDFKFIKQEEFEPICPCQDGDKMDSIKIEDEEPFPCVFSSNPLLKDVSSVEVDHPMPPCQAEVRSDGCGMGKYPRIRSLNELG